MRKPKSPDYYSITKNTVNNAYNYVWFKLQHCNVEKRLTFSQNWRGVQEMKNSVCNILTQIVIYIKKRGGGSIILVVLTAHHRPTRTSCNGTCRLTKETCYFESSCIESNDTKLNLNLLGTGENMSTFPLGCNQRPIGQHLLYNIGLHTTIQEHDTI